MTGTHTLERLAYPTRIDRDGIVWRQRCGLGEIAYTCKGRSDDGEPYTATIDTPHAVFTVTGDGVFVDVGPGCPVCGGPVSFEVDR